MKTSLPYLLAATLVAGCSVPRNPDQINSAIRDELNSSAEATPKPRPAGARPEISAPRVELPPVEGRVERFDLSVADAPVRRVFMTIVAGTPYSVLVHPTVKGTVTVNLKNVTVQEAMEALRELYDYEYRIQGTRIIVQSAGMTSRVFRVNYLVGQRLGRSDVRVTSGSVSDTVNSGASASAGAAPAAGQTGGRVIDSSRVTTSTRSDFWSELQETVRSIVGSEGGRSVIVNPQAGVVVVRAMPSEMRQVESYLRTIRDSVERQVMLEAKIIEVTLSDAFQSGVNWAAFRNGRLTAGTLQPNTTLGATGTLSSAQITADTAGRTLARNETLGDVAGAGPGLLTPGLVTGSMLSLASQTSTFASLIQFLEAQGSVQVLSSPRIAALNNQKAVLKVGTDEFFVTNVSGGSTAAGATSGSVSATTTFPTLTLQPFFSGVALDVTPQIDDDGSVILHVHPQVSNVQQDNRSLNLGTVFGGQVVLPTARSTVSETDSIVRVLDSNIVAIGGLMKVDVVDRRSGIPVLNALPLIGGLFGSRDRVQVKKELVILIKPTVVASSGELPNGTQDARARVLGMSSGNPAR